MIKALSSVLAITFAAAGLTACAGMDGAPHPEAVMTQMGSRAPSAQVIEESGCSMQENQGLVGQNLNTLSPATSRSARVLPAGTKLDSQPFVANRLTILYNPANNTITDVRCG